ncbi:M23 family metallopeptidase [Candidatus Trichorickettsia mobilis]|uniref:M23 family metallopeptidase n=1 Tax=Candidatus Trichorickettsia mobilis TaxID=1346319 RepID=A0ABZ0URW5_9RICK|nr:M23 family metallopeptidase [Candidatus Trichorickettsia mobilis]
MIIPFRISILFLLALIISACSTTNVSQKLLNKIDVNLEKNYQIKSGYLIAVYNLTDTKAECLYAKDFCRIINDDAYAQNFLTKFNSRYANRLNIINQQAMIKIQKLQKLLFELNNKYKFLSRTELRTASHILYDNQPGNIFLAIDGHHQIIYLHELSRLDQILQHLPLLVPILNPKITSNYGMRKHPITKRRSFHYGLDLVGHKSAPIYATATGVVSKISRVGSYGNMIEITHRHKFTTRFAHLNKIYVKEGELVIRGQKIGLQGNSGNTKGEHLHFEVLLNDQQLNPLGFVAHSLKN